jgi:chlorite dismutase
VDALTIQKDETVLQKQVQELKEKSNDNEYIVKGMLQEKDEEIMRIKEQMTSILKFQEETQKTLHELRLRNYFPWVICQMTTL